MVTVLKAVHHLLQYCKCNCGGGLVVPCKVYGNFGVVNVSTLHHKGVYGITK